MSGRYGEKAYPIPGRAEPEFGPEPSDADLSLIRRFALRDLSPQDVYVRRMVLANDAVDRSYERFPVPVLERLAQTLPGKSLLIAHDKSQPATGLIYDAHVRPGLPGEPGTHSLVASFYLVKTPENEELRRQIDGGVMRHVSIGFRYDQRLCDVCGDDYWSCPHVPGESLPAPSSQLPDRTAPGTGSREPGAGAVTYHYGGDLARYEASEASLVHLGCQRGAMITKEDDRRQATGDSSDDSPLSSVACHLEANMENEKALARIKELEQERAGLVLEREGLKTDLEKALAELKTTRAERDGFPEQHPAPSAQHPAHSAGSREPGAESLVEDGKAYRDHLREEVKRLAGILKCEAEANLLLAALPYTRAKELGELVESYQKRVEEKFPPRGVGEPMSHGMGRGDGARRGEWESGGRGDGEPPFQPIRF